MTRQAATKQRSSTIRRDEPISKLKSRSRRRTGRQTTDGTVRREPLRNVELRLLRDLANDATAKRERKAKAQSSFDYPLFDDEQDDLPLDQEPDFRVSATMAAAVAPIARLLHDRPRLERDLRAGRPTTVLLRVPDGMPTETLQNVVRALLPGPHAGLRDLVDFGDGNVGDVFASRGERARSAVIVQETTFQRGKSDGRVLRFVRQCAQLSALGLPAVILVPEADETVDRAARYADHDVRVANWDAAAIRSIIRMVTDENIVVRNLDRASYEDILAAVSPVWGAKASLKKLRRLARTSASAATARGEGPRLEDLKGYGKAREIGLEIAADLRAYSEGRLDWSQIDTGMLLHGAPGTGKTSFARALARSANATFHAASYAKWQAAGHLGDYLKAMRATFADARRDRPSVLLIDEIDSLRKRGTMSSQNDEYLSQCVNAFLEAVDGAETEDGVFVIGATNHPQLIDPAILRSGRLERVVGVPVPDVEGLAAIIRFHLGTDLPDADLEPLAALGVGGTGADAEGWVRRARGTARRAGRDLTEKDLRDAITEGENDLSDDLLWRMCVHEAGHALAAIALRVGTVRTMRVGPRGGLVETNATFEFLTSGIVDRRIVQSLAGRAAEIALLGEPSSGAGGDDTSDLAIATALARDAETRFGFGECGPVWLASTWIGGEGDDRVASAVERRLFRAEEAALALVRKRADEVTRLAEALRERRYLDADAVRASLGCTVATAQVSKTEAPSPPDKAEQDHAGTTSPSKGPCPARSP